MGEFNVNKSDGSLDPTAGMPETYPAEQVMMSDSTTSVEDALDELSDKFVMETYTLSYDSATNLRVTGITPPTGCSLERMIILPPSYNAVTVKVANILRISTTSGIIALGSGFATTDTISLAVLYFKN